MNHYEYEDLRRCASLDHVVAALGEQLATCCGGQVATGRTPR